MELAASRVGRRALAGAAALLCLSAVVPPPASASIADWIVNSVMQRIFGDGTTFKGMTPSLVTWLVGVPNFGLGGQVEALERTTTAIGFGLLGAILTLAVVRYYMAGLSPSGAGAGAVLEALSRSIGAALFLLAWPWVFTNAVALANVTTTALMHSGTVRTDTAAMFAAAFVLGGLLAAGGVVGLIVVIIMAIAGALVLLALVMLKVATGAVLALIFVAAPLVIVLWPVAELSWLARYVMRALTVIVLLPLIWALCFATFSAIGLDALTFQGGGGLLDKFLKPTAALGLLFVVATIPLTLLKVARMGQGDAAGGFLSHAASYLAARQVGAAAQQFIPESMGGSKDGGGEELLVTRNAATGDITGVRQQERVTSDSPAGQEATRWAQQHASGGQPGSGGGGASGGGGGGSGVGAGVAAGAATGGAGAAAGAATGGAGAAAGAASGGAGAAAGAAAGGASTSPGGASASPGGASTSPGGAGAAAGGAGASPGGDATPPAAPEPSGQSSGTEPSGGGGGTAAGSPGANPEAGGPAPSSEQGGEGSATAPPRTTPTGQPGGAQEGGA